MLIAKIFIPLLIGFTLLLLAGIFTLIFWWEWPGMVSGVKECYADVKEEWRERRRKKKQYERTRQRVKEIIKTATFW